MNRPLSILKALVIALCSGTIASITPTALAQPKVQVHAWDQTGTLSPSGSLGQIQIMIPVRIDTFRNSTTNAIDGYAAGQHTACEVHGRLVSNGCSGLSAGYSSPTGECAQYNIVIMPHNFGNYWGVNVVNEADAIADPGTPYPDQTVDFSYAPNPWLDAGSAAMQAWFTDFLTGYREYWSVVLEPNEEMPTPEAFALDSETALTNCCDVNATYLLWATAKDPRWTDPDYPIPGFTNFTLNGISVPPTGHNLYLQGKAQYGWQGIA